MKKIVEIIMIVAMFTLVLSACAPKEEVTPLEENKTENGVANIEIEDSGDVIEIEEEEEEEETYDYEGALEGYTKELKIEKYPITEQKTLVDYDVKYMQEYHKVLEKYNDPEKDELYAGTFNVKGFDFPVLVIAVSKDDEDSDEEYDFYIYEFSDGIAKLTENQKVVEMNDENFEMLDTIDGAINLLESSIDDYYYILGLYKETEEYSFEEYMSDNYDDNEFLGSTIIETNDYACCITGDLDEKGKLYFKAEEGTPGDNGEEPNYTKESILNIEGFEGKPVFVYIANYLNEYDKDYKYAIIILTKEGNVYRVKVKEIEDKGKYKAEKIELATQAFEVYDCYYYPVFIDYGYKTSDSLFALTFDGRIINVEE